jgi:hypothetical protein
LTDRSVLITGGCGSIRRRLVERILNEVRRRPDTRHRRGGAVRPPGQYGKEGRLRYLPESVRDRDGLTPQVVATGMHLSPRHGRTVEGIRADGFVVDR